MPTAPAPTDAPAQADGGNPLSNETDSLSLFRAALSEESWAPESLRAQPDTETSEAADDFEDLPDPTDEEEGAEPDPSTLEEAPTDETPSEPGAKPLGGLDPEKVSHWGAIVAQQPSRLSEVSPKHHAYVLDAAIKYTAQTVAQELVAAANAEMETVKRAGYREGFAAGQQQITDQATEGELEALARSDPEEFARVMLEEPEKMSRFAARKSAIQRGLPELQAEASRLLVSVAGDPYAIEKLRNAEAKEPARYVPTQEGLARLRQDIEDARVESRVARERAQPTAPSEAQRRQQAAQNRRTLPVTEPTSGGAPAGKAPLPDDPFELARMAAMDERKARAR